jgi:hypothetical protein
MYDVDAHLAAKTPDELAGWLVQSIRETVAPLLHLTDAQLAAHAAGRDPGCRLPDYLTPPMARLQLRLRAILAEHGSHYHQGTT